MSAFYHLFLVGQPASDLEEMIGLINEKSTEKPEIAMNTDEKSVNTNEMTGYTDEITDHSHEIIYRNSENEVHTGEIDLDHHEIHY